MFPILLHRLVPAVSDSFDCIFEKYIIIIFVFFSIFYIIQHLSPRCKLPIFRSLRLPNKREFNVHSYIVLFHQKSIFVLLYVNILYTLQH